MHENVSLFNGITYDPTNEISRLRPEHNYIVLKYFPAWFGTALEKTKIKAVQQS